MLARVAGAYRAAFSGLPRRVWILALAALVNRSGTMVLPFLSLYLTTQLSFTVLEAGRVLSLYGLGAIAGSWLGGALSDRVAPHRVQIASLVGTGAGFVALSRVHSRPAISLAVLALAVVQECFRPAMFTAATRGSDPAIRTRSLALVRMAVNVGMTVGPALGGFLAVRRYSLLFVADAATCWLAAGVLAVALGPDRDALRAPPPGRAAAALSPWRDRPFVAFLAAMVALGTVFFQIQSTMPLYFREHYRLAEDGIGLLLAINTVVVVAAEMVLLRAIERRDQLRVAGLGAALVGAGFALLPLGSTWPFAALTVLVWTCGEMLSVPLSNGVASRRAPAASSGRYMGAYSLAFAVAFVLAPALGTAVYQRVGPAALWGGVGAVGVALSLACLGLSRWVRLRPAGAAEPSAADPASAE